MAWDLRLRYQSLLSVRRVLPWDVSIMLCGAYYGKMREIHYAGVEEKRFFCCCFFSLWVEVFAVMITKLHLFTTETHTHTHSAAQRTFPHLSGFFHMHIYITFSWAFIT